MTVRARAYRPPRELVFDTSYTEEGGGQGGKMSWGGPFVLNSVVRGSSLEAYRKVFVRLRADLARVLAEDEARPAP